MPISNWSCKCPLEASCNGAELLVLQQGSFSITELNQESSLKNKIQSIKKGCILKICSLNSSLQIFILGQQVAFSRMIQELFFFVALLSLGLHHFLALQVKGRRGHGTCRHFLRAYLMTHILWSEWVMWLDLLQGMLVNVI